VRGVACRAGEGGKKEVDIVASLRAVAAAMDVAGSGGGEGLTERLGEGFVRGYRGVSSGVVPVEAFEELMARLRVREKKGDDGEDGDGAGGKKAKKKRLKLVAESSPQRNTLNHYFGRS